MTPFEIAALIGAVTGSFSIIYLTLKAVRDKPRLTFEEEFKMFYPPSGGNNFTTIVIRMKVHNRGTKPTTIHHSKLTFSYESKHHEVENDASFDILPNSTIDYSPSLNIHNSELVIHRKITDCVLTANHTHDKKMIDLGTIEEHKK